MSPFPRLLIAGLAIVPCAFADVTGDLDAFSKKLAESLSADQPSQGYARNAATQFQALKAAIARGDFDQAQAMLSNVGGYGVPPELQEEWQRIADQLAVEIVEMQRQAAIDWKKSVDSVAAKAGEACVKAKSSADLDDVLVEIASLQMKRVSSNNILSQRASQKLEGTARFVDQWIQYLDCRDAGDLRRANEILRNLVQNSSGYPLVSSAELQKFTADEPYAPNDYLEAVRYAFRDAKSTADIPAALDRLKELAKNPAISAQSRNWKPDEALSLVEAEQKLDAGDLAGARELIQNTGSSGLFSNVPGLASIRDDLGNRILMGEVAKIIGKPVEPGASVNKMLADTLDLLQKEGKFGEMARIMSAATEVQRGPRVQAMPWSASDLTAVTAYASGIQFEKAGDILPAVNAYRQTITAGQTAKYAPTKQAEEALARLKKSNPEAFEGVEGYVAEELRQMRGEIQRALMMQRRMPPY